MRDYHERDSGPAYWAAYSPGEWRGFVAFLLLAILFCSAGGCALSFCAAVYSGP